MNRSLMRLVWWFKRMFHRNARIHRKDTIPRHELVADPEFDDPAAWEAFGAFDANAAEIVGGQLVFKDGGGWVVFPAGNLDSRGERLIAPEDSKYRVRLDVAETDTDSVIPSVVSFGNVTIWTEDDGVGVFEKDITAVLSGSFPGGLVFRNGLGPTPPYKCKFNSISVREIKYGDV